MQSAPSVPAPPSVAHMLQSVIAQGITEQNVAALDKLCTLYERMESKAAEKMFAAAFCDLQNELPAVQATQAVPTKDGGVKFKFAPYTEIMRQVQPLLSKHGFTVRFSQLSEEGKITMTCTLMHVGGHSIVNQFTVRIGSGPPGASEAQADGSAGAYAQRGALCDALNIVVRHDDDARVEGAKITADQAFELSRRVMETNSDREAFLRYAGAATFADIPSSKYMMLDASLRKKEQTKPKA